MAIDTLMVFVGTYDTVEAAEADYKLVHDLHTEADLIDAWDGAVIERRDDGKSVRALLQRAPRRRQRVSTCCKRWNVTKH